jgi:ribosome-binding factor A
MTIGILKIILFIHDSNSLKQKRMVLHSLKARLRNNFNIAVTQIADEDKWQKATLVIAGVEKNKGKMNSILSRIVNFMEDFGGANLVDYEIELI